MQDKTQTPDAGLLDAAQVERLNIIATCDTDSAMRHFAYAYTKQSPEGDYVRYSDFAALSQQLSEARADIERLEEKVSHWLNEARRNLKSGREALDRAEAAEAKLATMDAQEKDRWQKWAQKRLDIQSKHWLRAAKSALAGDIRELRNRVELAETAPVEVVTSATLSERDAPQTLVVDGWRYEIQHGPEGETDYAWVYRGKEMICTTKTHHAIAIVSALTRPSTTEAKPDADAAMFTDYLGCEIVSTDVASIERAAAAATNGPMPVTYYRAVHGSKEAMPVEAKPDLVRVKCSSCHGTRHPFGRKGGPNDALCGHCQGKGYRLIPRPARRSEVEPGTDDIVEALRYFDSLALDNDKEQRNG